MKKALIIFMTALTVGSMTTVFASAHCHGARNSQTTTAQRGYDVCNIDGCDIDGLHMHDGQYYRCQDYREVGCGRYR